MEPLLKRAVSVDGRASRFLASRSHAFPAPSTMEKICQATSPKILVKSY